MEETLTVTHGGKGYHDGVLKKTYYTPDGRTIKAPPSMRNYIIKGTNEGGIRDANYDKGWLETMPSELKPYCGGCDKWHDTQEGVDECISKKAMSNKRWEKNAKKDVNTDEIDGRVKALEKSMANIENLLTKLVENNNG